MLNYTALYDTVLNPVTIPPAIAQSSAALANLLRWPPKPLKLAVYPARWWFFFHQAFFLLYVTRQ